MKKLLVIVLLYFLVGCSATVRGRPDRIIPDEVIAEDIASITSLDSIKKCNEDKTKECRDRIIYATILGIDMKYHNFENALNNDDRRISFLSTVTNIGLTAAGAYTGAPAFAAISSGLLGADAAYESSMLQNQMISTLLNQMSSQRNTIKARIFSQLTLSFTEYPLNLASIDLEAYYSGGTLLTAMKQLNTVASANAVNASKTLQAVNPSSNGNKE